MFDIHLFGTITDYFLQIIFNTLWLLLVLKMYKKINSERKKKKQIWG